jgi:hypothetical protein
MYGLDTAVSSDRNALVYTEKELKLHVTGEEDSCFSSHDEDKTSSSLESSEALHFWKHGFFCLNKAVSKHVINDARRYVDLHYNKWLKISKRQDDWRCHLQLDISNLSTSEPTQVEHLPILNLLLKSPVIMDRLRCMMGSEPSGIFYSQIAYRTPVKAAKKVKTKLPSLDYVPGAEYHLDGSANGQGTRFPDPWTVMVGVALVDIQSLDMGNFTVFPGSHTGRDWSQYPEEKVSKTLPTLGETVHVCLPAGGVVFAHVLLAHRGGKNEKTKDEDEETNEEDDIPFSLNLDNTSEEVSEEPDYVARFIPTNTREMVFIRVQARGIDYTAPQRAAGVVHDPWFEFDHMRETYIDRAVSEGEKA